MVCFISSRASSVSWLFWIRDRFCSSSSAKMSSSCCGSSKYSVCSYKGQKHRNHGLFVNRPNHSLVLNMPQSWSLSSSSSCSHIVVGWLQQTQLSSSQFCHIPRLHYQPVSSRFSSCALSSPVSTSVCVYITTARTGQNQRQLVRLFHSTVAGSRAAPTRVRTCR